MHINGLPDNLQAKQLSNSQTEATLQIFLDKVPDKGDKVRDVKEEVKSTSADIIKSKNVKEAVNNLINNLASSLVASGIKLGRQDSFLNKTERAARDEYDLMLGEGEGKMGDQVEIRDKIQKAQLQKRMTQDGQEGGEEQQSSLSGAKKDTVSKFTRVYAQFLMSGSNELKKKAEGLEKQMREEGMSQQDVIKLEGSIRKSIRMEFSAEVKEAILKKLMSPDKSVERALNVKGFNRLLDFAFLNEKLGGWDFGGFKGNLQGLVDEEIMAAAKDLRTFVHEELEHKFIEKTISKGKADQELVELAKLADKVGFDIDGFLQGWEKKRVDLGLVPFTPPANPMAAEQSGSGFSQNSGTGYEYTPDDEKELLLNQMRALYMQRALYGDLRTMIETSFKMMKLRNQLIKLSISFEDLDKTEKQLSGEGKVLAKQKMMEVLKEALVERASLFTLAGPSYTLVEKKIKGAMKNLERLGVTLSNSEFESLRDDANRQVCDEALSELKKINIALEVEKHPYLEQKQGQLIQTIMRLREESGITSEVDPELQMLFAGDKRQTIMEAA